MSFDSQKTCRTCLNTTDETELLPIISSVEGRLSTIAAVKLDQSDGLPYKVCLPCLENINRSFFFKLKCEKSEEILRQLQKERELAEFTRKNDSCNKAQIADTSYTSGPIQNEFIPIDVIVKDEEICTEQLMGQVSMKTRDTLFDTLETVPGVKVQIPTTVDSLLEESRTEQPTDVETCNENSFNEKVKIKVKPLKELTGLPKANFHCQYCIHSFVYENSLKEHLESSRKCRKKSNKEYRTLNLSPNQCRFCNAEISDDIRAHEQAHRKEKPFVCGKHLCKSRFSFDFQLKSHVARHLKSKLRPIINNPEEFKCPHCQEVFQAQSFLTCHLWTSKVCYENSKKLKALESPTKKELRVPMKKIQCESCKNDYKSQYSLRKHICGLGSFKCTSCKKEFKNPASLKLHLCKGSRLHCSTCGKLFGDKSKLERHILYHKYFYQKKPFAGTYKCSKCPEVFSQSSNLVSHLIAHYKLEKQQPAEKPERIEQVPKQSGFDIESVLTDLHGPTDPDELKEPDDVNSAINKTIDITISDGEPEIIKESPTTKDQTESTQENLVEVNEAVTISSMSKQCPICGKDFPLAKYLERHMRVHTGETKFDCSICGKHFKFRANLRRHKSAIHSSEKSSLPHGFNHKRKVRVRLARLKLHSCWKCNEQFVEKYRLDDHLRSKHQYLEIIEIISD